MHVDLVVVGAGVLGTFHAYHAARHGLNVALPERGAMPNGASVRIFGMVSATIVMPGSEWAAYAQSSSGKGMTTGPGFAEASVQAMFGAGNQGN